MQLTRFNIGTKSSTIVLSHESKAKSVHNYNEVLALAILIDTSGQKLAFDSSNNKISEIKKQFQSIIEEMKVEIYKIQNN